MRRSTKAASLAQHSTTSRAVSDTCLKYLSDLRSRDEIVRQRAARNLKIHVVSQVEPKEMALFLQFKMSRSFSLFNPFFQVDPGAKEMAPEDFNSLLKELNRHIQSMVNSVSNPHEQLGGIAAIGLPFFDSKNKRFFTHFIRCHP